MINDIIDVWTYQKMFPLETKLVYLGLIGWQNN
jgi:hypothetical protein